MNDRAEGSQPQNAEIAEKLQRIENLLDSNKAGAVLLSRHGNIAWITAGQVEARVAQSVETAVCSLLLTRDGRRYYLAPNNEAARLHVEEFAGLGYEPVIYPWHESPTGRLQEILNNTALCADTPHANAKLVNLTTLQTPLFPTEIDRLRALSSETAAATAEVLQSLTPGVTEHEMTARVSSALLARAIDPTVLLMATDERIHRYKHAVPRAGVLKRYGMLNLCARRNGLIVSITRFVHFGPVPAELAAAFEAAAQINAALLHATRNGAISSEIFATAQRAYASVGAAGEIQNHHQGGPCGYAERDWVITPHGIDRVAAPQAFAWNPSLRGAKAEDTVLLADNKIEVLTATPDLPTIDITIDNTTYRSAGVLVQH